VIQALIFDFDGLILDTETPEYQSWQEIYQDHACSLSLAEWGKCVGTSDVFEPYDYLAAQSGRPIDRSAIQEKRRTRFAQLMETQSILPGVEQILQDARQRGLKVGIASSSSRSWVRGHLARYGLDGHFDCTSCADDVAQTKPDPALYLHALKLLGVEAHEAVAFEDSPNGALAARRAGIFCIVVPNALTQQLPFATLDLQLPSLAHMPLGSLLAHIEERMLAGS
jgi:HAD superfamily hydrolase (TIGR01509 family)